MLYWNFSKLLCKIVTFKVDRNKCCIEIYIAFKALFAFKVEPKQMLYWNWHDQKKVVINNSVEPKQMLYWNRPTNTTENLHKESNRNKCCIEILLMILYVAMFEVEPKQMLYWNALRSKSSSSPVLSNRNKCCIEIEIP